MNLSLARSDSTVVPLRLQVPYVNSTIAIFLDHKEAKAACQVKCRFLLRQSRSRCLPPRWEYFYWHPFLEGALGVAGEMNESRGARNAALPPDRLKLGGEIHMTGGEKTT